MKKLVLSVFALVITCCNKAQEAVSPTAAVITNVNIIDVRNGTILENRNIIVDSGKIKSIRETLPNPGAYTLQIDGTGKYALPGLAEMHAHIPSPETPRERIDATLFLYLSNGITTIRGMLGHPSHLVLREQAKSGEILSPRIFTSSPSLNGNSVATREEARTKVTQYAAEGYDFLKIHPGIQLEAFDEVVKTADSVEIPFAGHVPVDVGIRHALESGYSSIDHVDGFLEGLVPDSQNVDPDSNGFFGFNFTPLADTTKIDELVQLARKNKVWIVPTQSLFERWFAPVSSAELLAQPEMIYMPVSTLEDWKKRKEETTGSETGFDEDQWKHFDAIRKQLILALQREGHGMLLGSDAPQLFNVPGFSIHHEMAGMVAAGLTPLQILQSGTLNPAVFFGMEGVFGELKQGLDADIILADGNPLEDIAALKQPSGVMVRGRWLSRAALDAGLAKIAEKAQQE